MCAPACTLYCVRSTVQFYGMYLLTIIAVQVLGLNKKIFHAGDWREYSWSTGTAVLVGLDSHCTDITYPNHISQVSLKRSLKSKTRGHDDH